MFINSWLKHENWRVIARRCGKPMPLWQQLPSTSLASPPEGGVERGRKSKSTSSAGAGNQTEDTVKTAAVAGGSTTQRAPPRGYWPSSAALQSGPSRGARVGCSKVACFIALGPNNLLHWYCQERLFIRKFIYS